jgi:cytochrome c biogenesis protein CcdA
MSQVAQPATPGKQAALAMTAVGGIALVFVAVAFFGTALYNYYIPEIAVARNFQLGLLAIPILGGAAAFLSPCAFGMLPAYFAAVLAVRSAEDGRTAERRLGPSMRYGAATAAGMLTAGIVLALAVALLGAAFAAQLRVVTAEPNLVVRNVRLFAGLLLVAIGLFHLSGRHLPLVGRLAGRSPVPVFNTAQPTGWFFAYGMLYLVVALPCVANLLAAPLLYSVATGGAVAGAATAVLFVVTMASMALLVAIFMGLSKEAVVHRLRASGRHLSRVAGALFTFVGATLVYLNLNLDTFRTVFFHFPILD